MYIQGLRESNEASFEALFHAFYDPLYGYAYTLLRDNGEADEVVQAVFVLLWESRKKLLIQHSLKAYLYRSVYHAVLASDKRRDRDSKYVLHLGRTADAVANRANNEVAEIETIVTQVMKDLPEGCRTIFQLSRYEGMRYKEIAEHLQISVKTVEAQITKALKIFRAKLVDYLPLLVFWILF
jgi:RNA polymerase sigma-70 factor (ECF subfamily)